MPLSSLMSLRDVLSRSSLVFCSSLHLYSESFSVLWWENLFPYLGDYGGLGVCTILMRSKLSVVWEEMHLWPWKSAVHLDNLTILARSECLWAPTFLAPYLYFLVSIPGCDLSLVMWVLMWTCGYLWQTSLLPGASHCICSRSNSAENSADQSGSSYRTQLWTGESQQPQAPCRCHGSSAPASTSRFQFQGRDSRGGKCILCHFGVGATGWKWTSTDLEATWDRDGWSGGWSGS
jgi:hypothetical protein